MEGGEVGREREEDMEEYKEGILDIFSRIYNLDSVSVRKIEVRSDGSCFFFWDSYNFKLEIEFNPKGRSRWSFRDILHEEVIEGEFKGEEIDERLGELLACFCSCYYK